MAPQAPQLPPSVAVLSQVIGTTTPTTSRPFAPAPIVCEKVNPLAPVPVALASMATPPAPAAVRGDEEPGRGDRQRVEDDQRGESFPSAHAGDQPERQHQLQHRAARIARGDGTTARWPAIRPVPVRRRPSSRRRACRRGEVAGAPPVASAAPAGRGVTGPYQAVDPSRPTSSTQYETAPSQPGEASFQENDDAPAPSAPPEMTEPFSWTRPPAPSLR